MRVCTTGWRVCSLTGSWIGFRSPVRDSSVFLITHERRRHWLRIETGRQCWLIAAIDVPRQLLREPDMRERLGWSRLAWSPLISLAFVAALYLYNYKLVHSTEFFSLLQHEPLLLTVVILDVGLFQPVVEEIVFRGVLFKSLLESFGFWQSAIISSLVFAAWHIDLQRTGSLLIVGLAMAFLYERHKSIPLCVMTHGTVNLTNIVAIDLLVRLTGNTPLFD